MEEKKSYIIDMSMEILTDDGENVKAVRIHDMKVEPMPVRLFCDFLGRLGQMTQGEPVMLVSDGPTEPLVEKDKGYVITGNYAGFIPGDIFKGVSDHELQHARSGKVISVYREMMDRLFRCCGDFNETWAEPISEDTRKILEELKYSEEL